MAAASGDFELTMDELRAVARYVAESAQIVLPAFEAAHPDDARPRTAIEAAWTFANGAARTKLQRVTALDAHRAAKEVTTEEARLAARCAGDAAGSAYLHPLAQATQVGHILRSAASAARIAELQAGGDPAVGDRVIARSAARRRARSDRRAQPLPERARRQEPRRATHGRARHVAASRPPADHGSASRPCNGQPFWRR